MLWWRYRNRWFFTETTRTILNIGSLPLDVFAPLKLLVPGEVSELPVNLRYFKWFLVWLLERIVLTVLRIDLSLSENTVVPTYFYTPRKYGYLVLKSPSLWAYGCLALKSPSLWVYHTPQKVLFPQINTTSLNPISIAIHWRTNKHYTQRLTLKDVREIYGVIVVNLISGVGDLRTVF